MAKNGKNFSAAVTCPWYRGEDRQLIYCTGIQPDTALHLAFAYPADKSEFKDTFCGADHDGCPIAAMLAAGRRPG